jgi:HPt (histidine-containing phosphotransfer) domain-containing protein
MQTTTLPIDFAALTELMGGNHDGVCSLLEMFVSELLADLTASTIAIEANDRTTLQQIAHRLKGTSANLTAPMLSATASELEQSCKEADDAAAVGEPSEDDRAGNAITRGDCALAR